MVPPIPNANSANHPHNSGTDWVSAAQGGDPCTKGNDNFKGDRSRAHLLSCTTPQASVRLKAREPVQCTGPLREQVLIVTISRGKRRGTFRS